jgi:hypothetical protein
LTTTEQILLAGLVANVLGSVWLWTNHQFSAKADRRELFRRMRKVEVKLARIMERLDMKEEDET